MNLVQSKRIMVWDPALRMFHWLLVVCFVAAYGLTSEDKGLNLHLLVGYSIVGLLLFRVIWGFIGTKYARFQQFLFPLFELKQHLKRLRQGKGRPTTGHNPIGSIMVFSLLLMLFTIVLSGLMLDGIQREGPLAELMTTIPHTWEYVLQTVHGTLADITVLMVIFHICGAVVESWLLGENLIVAMFTGRKQYHGDD